MSKKNVLLITLAKIMNYTSPLITFPLLVKAFSITDYGIWIETSTIIGLFYSLLFVGFVNATNILVMRKTVKEDVAYTHVLYLLLALGFLVGAIIFIAAPLLNSLTIRQPVGITVLRISAFLIPVNSLPLLASEIYRFRQKATMSAVIEISIALSRPVVAIFAFLSKDLITFTIIYVSSQVIISILFICTTYYTVKLSKPSLKIFRELISNGLNLSIVSQSSWVVMYGDRLMLSIFSVSAAVAIYSASYQLTSILLALGSPYLYTLLPVLGEHWKAKNIKGIHQAVYQNTRYMLVLIIPSIIGLTLTSTTLLTFLANEQFAVGNILTLMISIGIGLETLGIALQYIFYAQGRPQVLRNIYLRAAVFNIIGNLVAIPLLSYNGAGLITLVTFVYIFYSLWRKTEMPFTDLFDVSAIWRCIAASLVMGVWLVLTAQSTILGLVIAIVGGAIIYGIGIITLKVISLDEALAIPRSILRRMNILKAT